MTQEDKELLLRDLSARLPYGVICKCYHTEFDEWDGKPFVAIYNETLKNIDVNGVFLVGSFSYEIDEVKPYLRPMSSMTEEERKYLQKLPFPYDFVDWLTAHHFDYRGLIEKGLALEATSETYNKK